VAKACKPPVVQSDICFLCYTGKIITKTGTFTFEADGGTILSFEDAEWMVCKKCGQVFIPKPLFSRIWKEVHSESSE